MSAAIPVLIGLVVVASAAVAMSLRNLIHSALCLAVCWFGIAAFFLWAGAEFVAFAQVLVYVGAVSMVVLFAVLLTRPSREGEAAAGRGARGRAAAGICSAAVVAGVLCGAVLATGLEPAPGAPKSAAVRTMGERLAGPEAVALLAVGVLLTVALIGAVVIAAQDGKEGRAR